MGLFKRLAGLLGFARDEEQLQHDDAASDATIPSSSTPGTAPPAAFASAQHLPRRGFSVPVQVPVERAPPPPLLVFCPAGDGGIQGLRWYARRLRMDEDGDIADEFLDEVPPDMSTDMEEHDKQLPRFEVKYRTRPAKVKNLDLLPNGRILHLVEYQVNSVSEQKKMVKMKYSVAYLCMHCVLLDEKLWHDHGKLYV